MSTVMSSLLESGSSALLPVGSLHHSVAWLQVLFRTMALFIAFPIILLASLDVAAYLIARTLGQAHHRHLKASASSTSFSRDDSQPQEPQPTIVITSPPPPPVLSGASTEEGYLHHTHFSSSSDGGNFALAGEGVFSPPESRAGSPPRYRTNRPRSGSCAGVVEPADDTSSEASSTSSFSDLGASSSGSGVAPPSPSAIRRRNHPGLQLTPMNP